MRKPPTRKSKLEPYTKDILSLHREGLSEQKIVAFLATEKNITVSRQALSNFIKKLSNENYQNELEELIKFFDNDNLQHHYFLMDNQRVRFCKSRATELIDKIPASQQSHAWHRFYIRLKTHTRDKSLHVHALTEMSLSEYVDYLLTGDIFSLEKAWEIYMST